MKKDNKNKNRHPGRVFTVGGVVPQQVRDSISSSIGGGPIGDLMNIVDNSGYRRGIDMINKSYNLNPVASNNDELMDLYHNKTQLGHITSNGVHDALGVVSSGLQGAMLGNSIGGKTGGIIGAGLGLFTGMANQAENQRRINRANEAIDFMNQRQDLAIQNAANNLATRRGLEFESGYFRHGGELNYFDNGGSHEHNVFGGIPQGIDSQGIPNLVEEGEIKWSNRGKDFIFSDKEKINDDDIFNFNLPQKYKGKTIAKAVKSAMKESEERPNDPISNNEREHILNIFKSINEAKISTNKQDGKQNVYVKGGEPKTEDWRLSQFNRQQLSLYDPILKNINTHRVSNSPVMLPAATNSQESGWADWFRRIHPVTIGGVLYSPHEKQVEPPIYNTSNYQGFNDSPDVQTNTTGSRRAAVSTPPEPEIKKRDQLIPKIVPPLLNKYADSDPQMIGRPVLSSIKKRPFLEPSGNPLNFDGVGNALLALSPAIAGALDRPNYTYVNEMRNSFRPVDTPFISTANYMRYRPVDVDYLTNGIRQRGNANAGNLMNMSGGNRNTAAAGLLANDYSTQLAEAQALLGAMAQNRENYQKVQAHNTNINQFDINSYNTTARFNAQGAAQARQTAAMMGQQEYDGWKDRRYANLSQALTNLQNLKKEGWINDQLEMLVKSGAIAWDPRTGQYVAMNGGEKDGK